MFALYRVEECMKIWSTEMSYGAKSSEKTSIRDLLEMPLTNILQHKMEHIMPHIKTGQRLYKVNHDNMASLFTQHDPQSGSIVVLYMYDPQSGSIVVLYMYDPQSGSIVVLYMYDPQCYICNREYCKYSLPTLWSLDQTSGRIE